MRGGILMITLENVQVSFHEQQILRDVSYVFEDHLFYLITARNGAGKTTLLNTIANLLPYNGNITFDLKPDDFFYIPHDYQFVPHMTGMDYYNLYWSLWESKADLTEIITALKINDFINKKISEYSLGMRQLFVLGLYLVSDTQLWMMDELNNGLDNENLNVLLEQLRIAKKAQRTILFVTHQTEDVSRLADIVVDLTGGTLHERMA
ncbi:ATP-binding cassette domain-containing protein [Lactiplantibacillus pentosus]|nr:ATP-binding cassette domain-containing protein [Lactiplantibacillus pentosus]AYG41745.1 ATP-binding cassette domain-containing protein [Lactiplantibacillus pentosus]